MRKSLLVAMMLCCSVLFGCAKGQTIDQDALAEIQEEHELTYEEWRELEDAKEQERGKKAQEEHQKAMEQYEKDMAEREKQEQLEANKGMTYDNFLLIGTDDFMTVEDINELLDCNGDLVSEYGSHTVYQWEFREKKSFKDVGKLKIVTVGFENGKAISKNQVGL